MTETEINIKAAKIIGHNIKGKCNICGITFPAEWDACPNVECGNTDLALTFDIFNSAANREAVMIALAKKYSVRIEWYGYADCHTPYPHWHVDDLVRGGGGGFKTHKEALVAAVEGGWNYDKA